MSSRLLDRLNNVRRQRFIGRTGELALFARALAAAEPPFFVLYVYGPGGVGKTTLLSRFARTAQEAGVTVAALDARNLELTPAAFLGSLSLALGGEPNAPPVELLAQQPGRTVILLDTYELMAPLDDWLRDVFLPQLPDQVLTVLASRHAPAPPWRADPGWQPLLHVLPLRNLSPEEGHAYLAQRSVPADDLQAVLDFTHSYPLALSLVADLYDQRPGYHFKPLEAPDVVKLLLEQFLQAAPGPAHRAALEACALVRVTTESLLAELLAAPDAHDLFAWLRSLSFIETRPGGLFPHDIAREVLVADLRWRNPNWYAELHRRARACFSRRLAETRGAEQQLTLFDYVYLHRDNPAVRPFFEWQTSGRAAPDQMHGDDIDKLTAMVRRHEGETAAQLAHLWMIRQPENVIVFRASSGQPDGFMVLVAMERVTVAEQAADPALALACGYLRRHGPLRPGERATYFRYWMAGDTHQAVSPIQSLIFINMVRHYFTPSLAYTFYACTDPLFWRPVFAYADLARLPELDFAIDGRAYGVYGHDWRATPPAAWLDLLGQRETALAPEAVKLAESGERLAALSQDAFLAAVEQALRDYTRPDVLYNSPLLHTQMVASRAGKGSTAPAQVAALRALLKEAAEQLRESPKESKFSRAVHHPYIQPAPTQELAAELLDVPFSSYRRHLKAGMARIAEILWQVEAGQVEAEQAK